MTSQKELWKAAGRRLATARLRAGYETQRHFALAVELAEPTIAKYEQGAREIPLSLLFWLSEQHGINIDWVVTGKGDWKLREPRRENIKEFAKRLDDAINRATSGSEQPTAQIAEDQAPYDANQPMVDAVLLQRLGDVVESVFVEVKQTPPRRAVIFEAGQLYDQLMRMTKQIHDPEVQEALIPVVRQRFKNRLLSAEPGNGKRSAS